MIEDLKQGRKIVEQILSEHPSTRDSDLFLLFECWSKQGIHIPLLVQVTIYERGFKPESIRRWRQKFQQAGKYLGTKRLEKQKEAERVKDYMIAEGE